MQLAACELRVAELSPELAAGRPGGLCCAWVVALPMDVLLVDFAAFAAVLHRLPLLLAAELEAVCLGTFLPLALLPAFACAKSGVTVSRGIVHSHTQCPPLVAKLTHVDKTDQTWCHISLVMR